MSQLSAAAICSLFRMLTVVLAGVAEHVLLQSLLPRLGLRSLQSLAHSCKALRTLITGDDAGLQVSQPCSVL